jgi:hypothetical protein
MKFAKRYWKLVKNSKKKTILKKKKILVKNDIFWPIVGDGICLEIYFGLFSVTMDQKFVLCICEKISWKPSIYSESYQKIAISRKAPYRIFSNMAKNFVPDGTFTIFDVQ